MHCNLNNFYLHERVKWNAAANYGKLPLFAKEKLFLMYSEYLINDKNKDYVIEPCTSV